MLYLDHHTYKVFEEAQIDQLYRRLLRDREEWHMLFYDYQMIYYFVTYI